LLFVLVVERLFERLHSLGVLLNAAEDTAPDLCFAAKLVKRRRLQNLGVFDVLHAVVGELVKQGFEHGASLVAVLTENISFPDVISALSPCKWLLVESNVSHEVKDI